MARYDLGFILCCCKAFLGNDEENEGQENFYALLNVDRDATPEELKKAFKRESLKNHPDKLQQRGLKVTEADQARFQRIKQAYEVLSDEHKRETYNAIGERGMKWVEEPFSIDPQELAHNFAKSNTVDRAKIFAIFVAIAIGVLILPILVCLHADGVFGENASWTATLTPLWLWDIFMIFYYIRVILMGPIPRPDHISVEEWQDPLPMQKRYLSLMRFILVTSFELLLALKLDNVVRTKWAVIFIPLYVWEATTLYKKMPLAKMRIVTVEDLEAALGKPFSDFSPEEKTLVGKRYSVVPSTSSPEFAIASKLKAKARQEMMKCGFRIAFVILLLTQIDGLIDWNWWLVFLPFWIMTAVICYANFKSFDEVKQAAAERDPTLFGLSTQQSPGGVASNYGTVGENGEATPSATAVPTSSLTEEEREELKAQVMASSSKLCSKCCSQGFVLILLFLFVSKLQGAAFSSFWILSPFLFGASLILCCLGCAIFGITEVNTDGVEFDTGDNDEISLPQKTDVPLTMPLAANDEYIPPPPADEESSAEPLPPDIESGNRSTVGAPPPTKNDAFGMTTQLPLTSDQLHHDALKNTNTERKTEIYELD